jgi:hypothetical protein
VHELERGVLRAGINRTSAIARSHYAANINLVALSQGYPDVYEEELEVLETEVAPFCRTWYTN